MMRISRSSRLLSHGRNARRVGEDFVASEMILPARHIVTSYEVGALLAGGVGSIEVMRKPQVAIIPTGSELGFARCAC